MAGKRSLGSRVRLVAGAVALAGALAAGAVAAVPPIHEGGVLHVDVSGPMLLTLDPAQDYETIGAQILFATCAKLVNYPDRSASASRQLVPDVAESLPARSDGGRTYTVTIRPGFRFETGEEVTAATFAHAINRDLSPALASPAAQFLRDVVGAAAVRSGDAVTASGVVASGDTLTITLTAPAPDFVARMAMSFFCAVPLGLPATPQGLTPIPSAGPYYVASATPHVALVLKRNPLYGGDRPHHLDEIRFQLETDGRISVRAIEMGDADYEAGVLPRDLLPVLADRYGVNRSQFLVHPDLDLWYLVLNTRRSLCRSAAVRKAVNLAVDRRAVLSASGSFGRPTDQILPPGMPGYRDAHVYPLGAPDLARARGLMHGRTASASLVISPDPADIAAAVAIQRELRRIGIRVSFRSTPDVDGALRRGNFDLALKGWAADYLDPYDFVNVLLRGTDAGDRSSQNAGGFSDPRFNARMDAAARLPGPSRYAAYARLDADLMRDAAPIVPLANLYLPELISRRVRVDCSVFPPRAGGLDYAAACIG